MVAPASVRAGIAWASTNVRIPATRTALPMSSRPSLGRLTARTISPIPTAASMPPRRRHRVNAACGFSRNQPFLVTYDSSRSSNVDTFLPKPSSAVESMCHTPSSVRVPIPVSSRRANVSAGSTGRRRFRAILASLSSGVLMSMPILSLPKVCGSGRNASSSRLARSSIAVVRVWRDDWPSKTSAPAGAVRSGGGAGMRIEGRRGTRGRARSEATTRAPSRRGR